MKLTDQEATEVLAKLGKRGALQPCAQCGNPKWGVVPHVFELIETEPEGRSLTEHLGLTSPARIPVVTIACTNCGHLALFSAKMLEVKDAPDPDALLRAAAAASLAEDGPPKTDGATEALRRRAAAELTTGLRETADE